MIGTPCRVGASTYVPQPSPHNVHSCAGCAANSPLLLSSERNTLCKALASCHGTYREDGLNVVWIKATAEDFK